MSSAGAFAFANVRARSRAARLLGPEAAAHLRAAATPAARAAALHRLGIEGDAADLQRGRVARLLDDYAVLARSYPVGEPLLVAMARLHEIENLKLLYRAAANGLPAERWRALFRPMGRLGTIQRADAEEVRSLRDLEAVTRATPYAEVVAAAVSGPALAPAEAELSFDRLGSRRLVEEARRLPSSQAGAGALVLGLVRERDLDAVRRAAAYSIAPELCAATGALLAGEPGWGHLAEIAAWTPDAGPLGLLLPRRLLGGAPVADWDALERALRRRRRRACAAAFIGSPLRLAPGVAYLLLAEEELRGLVALVEAAGAPAAGSVLERALAGSALGD